MLVVNLFGAPGSGKSTGSAYIFSQLKMHGVDAELVTEFAKDKVWEGNKCVFENQAYLFGKQSYRLSRLKDKVEVVVTDSPALLSAYYTADSYIKDEMKSLALKVHKSYNNLDVFVHRTKPYNPNGRFQTESESDQVCKELLKFTAECGLNCIHINGTQDGYDKIVRNVLNILNTEKAKLEKE